MRGLAVSALAMAGATAFAAATFGPTDAHALAAPSPFTSCYTSGGLVEGKTTSCAIGGATTDIKYDNPTVHATGAGGAINQGFAALDYDWVVTGGTYGTPVLVDVTALLQWSTTLDGVGFSEIVVGNGSGQTFHTICTGCASTPGVTGDDSWFGSLQIATAVGVVGSIHLQAQASAGNHGSAIASADPLLTIDASTPDAGQYSFAFSDGITNGVTTPGGVPEPASWALMLLGFGLGGAALRARRTVAA